MLFLFFFGCHWSSDGWDNPHLVRMYISLSCRSLPIFFLNIHPNFLCIPPLFLFSFDSVRTMRLGFQRIGGRGYLFQVKIPFKVLHSSSLLVYYLLFLLAPLLSPTVHLLFGPCWSSSFLIGLTTLHFIYWYFFWMRSCLLVPASSSKPVPSPHECSLSSGLGESQLEIFKVNFLPLLQ